VPASDTDTAVPAIQFALAILVVGGRFALQLRDTKQTIDAPGVWGLFGGRIEPGESPEAAVVREVREELELRLIDVRLLWPRDMMNEFHRQRLRMWIFEADVTDSWAGHRLHEGQATGLFSHAELAGLPIHPFAKRVLDTYHAEQKGGAP